MGLVIVDKKRKIGLPIYAASTAKRVIAAIKGTPKIGLAIYDRKHEGDGVECHGGD
jgi:hypothetical protein